MGEHVKKEVFKVLLSAEDGTALRELARLERDRRKDPELGSGTLLREYAMPHVRERLEELTRPSPELACADAVEERRTQPDRRQPIERAS